MGRGRGKGKKHTVISSTDDPGHGEEEKLPASKRRGRPQKPMKDEFEEDEEEEAEKIESDENAKSSTTSKDSAEQAAIDKGRKRKKPIQVKGNPDPINDSNGNVMKSVGFRPIGSRRKNKPCRAAEVGVKCK